MAPSTLKADPFVVHLQSAVDSLTIQLYNYVTDKHYKATILADVHFNPERVQKALLENKFDIKINETNVYLELGGGILALPIPEIQPDECGKLQVQLQFAQMENKKIQEEHQREIITLKEQLLEMQQKVATLGAAPAVLHFSTTGLAQNKTVIWDLERVPLNADFFAVSADKKQVTIKVGGVYRFDIQLLNVSGTVIYPFLIATSGLFSVYGYGSGPSYQTANINAIFQVPANTPVEVRLQTNEHVSKLEKEYHICDMSLIS